jgi:hypothetical protein
VQDAHRQRIAESSLFGVLQATARVRRRLNLKAEFL